uniref:Uncharacterized protein n=1 Tax=Magallana gigas TaxID=29159 RepID=A0A8W8N0V0_MAGGI
MPMNAANNVNVLMNAVNAMNNGNGMNMPMNVPMNNANAMDMMVMEMVNGINMNSNNMVNNANAMGNNKGTEMVPINMPIDVPYPEPEVMVPNNNNNEAINAPINMANNMPNNVKRLPKTDQETILYQTEGVYFLPSFSMWSCVKIVNDSGPVT